MNYPALSARCLACLGLALCLHACARNSTEATVMVCDPMCSERPLGQINQELRATDADDGRIAALEAAAAQHPRAAYDLALRYFRGDGIRRDSYQALSWMRVAAEHGDFDAQKALGRLYLTGLEEMGRDPREAGVWLSMAAGRGDRESERLLAEAEAARRSDEEEYTWLRRWRPVVYQWWRSGYSYHGVWNGQSWNY
ncbi:MAG: hypothetical protein LBU39_03700 [Desulfobulbaceae bacterium]|nr:hypothetical protein [Desulfobulbaceae bacterium]